MVISTSRADQVDVVVVGAGLAGLGTAARLEERGLRVQVLEARERVGGRVRSETLPGGPVVDLGAQFFSRAHERVVGLVRSLGLQPAAAPSEGRPLYDLGGKKRVVAADRSPLAWHESLDLAAATRRLDRLARQVPPGAPWTAAHAARWDGRTVEDWLRANLVTGRGRRLARIVLEEDACAPAGELSLLALLSMLSAMGGLARLESSMEYLLPGGGYQLPAGLARRLGRPVLTSRPVRHIEHDTGAVVVTTAVDTWRARAVVVALPPALAGHITYDPPLPAGRLQLAHRLGLGSVIKCVIAYETPFWRRSGRSGSVTSDTGDVRVVVDASPPGSAFGVLVAFVTGAAARRLSAVAPQRRRSVVLDALTGWFGPRAGRPLGYVEHDWSGDPWTGGGYTAIPAPGLLTAFGPALVRGVGPITWAGTETASEWRGYMEGALQSAERAAAEVLDRLADDDGSGEAGHGRRAPSPSMPAATGGSSW